ncbi:hypothetical protein ABEF95_004188 [Exophiala dermatitidis]
MLYRPWLPIIRPSNGQYKKKPIDRPRRTSTNPLKLLKLPHIVVALFYTGVVYAVNYTITATISSSFADIYPYLSETALGLCYLSTGGGMILGSTLTGKMLDREYRRAKQQWAAEADAENDLFPIERARLSTMPLLLAIFLGCVFGWGWCLTSKVSIAVPLILQFILGYTSISILNATMTLMIDVAPGQSSGVIACTNLMRCSLAALLVSVIDYATNALGYGWTYVLLGGISILLWPLMHIEMKYGPGWRAKQKATA